MSSGERRIDKLGNMSFDGEVARNIAAYAAALQKLARDMALELDTGGQEIRAAVWSLRDDPRLANVKLRRRARRVARHAHRASRLMQEVSAEAVRFNLQYRREFLEAAHAPPARSSSSRRVTL